MKRWSKLGRIVSFSVISLFFCSCGHIGKKEFDSVAYRPSDPSAVKLKVSLSKQVLYVMEDDRPLMVTPITVGKASTPTPKGEFKVIQKKQDKRSTSFGMYVNKKTNTVRPSRSGNGRPGEKYTGYPLPFWLRFNGAYGFHAGGVYPQPRTHGCIRVHKNVAPKLFAMTSMGTPVSVRDTQPEDATIGRNVARPSDWKDPDPPYSYILSDKPFADPAGPLFVN